MTMRLLPRSATYTLPSASTATPWGLMTSVVTTDIARYVGGLTAETALRLLLICHSTTRLLPLSARNRLPRLSIARPPGLLSWLATPKPRVAGVLHVLPE